MSATSAAIAGSSDMTLEDFRRVLEAYSSPALAEASGMYGALQRVGVRQSVFLAFFLHESRAGTLGVTPTYDTRNPGNVRSVADPASGGVVIDTPRGPFVRYPSWTAGTLDWAKRLRGSLYEGVGLRTVAQVIPKYAPATDSNDPEAYIRAVEALVKRYSRVAATGSGGRVMVGKPAMVSNPALNRGGYDTPIRKQAVVWHITDGTNSLSWLTSRASGVSANYLIDRDGTIRELVPWTEAAWVQGISQEPDTSNPVIADWVRRGVNFNTVATGIECEGRSTWGQPGALTTAQRVSLIALTAWLCQEQGHACDRTRVIRHSELQRRDRAGCPGYAESEMRDWIAAAAAQLSGARTATFAAAWRAGGAFTARWRAWRAA